jgi:hypothetical protein
VTVDLTLDEVNVGDYDALVLPGGLMNPDTLRINDKALAIVKAFVDSGRIVAAICHGPWLLVETGAVKDREVTSYISIRTTSSMRVAAGSTSRWRSTRGSLRPDIPGTSTPSWPRSSRKWKGVGLAARRKFGIAGQPVKLI